MAEVERLKAEYRQARLARRSEALAATADASAGATVTCCEGGIPVLVTRKSRMCTSWRARDGRSKAAATLGPKLRGMSGRPAQEGRIAQVASMSVDERAFHFSESLRQALAAVDFRGNVMPHARPWTTDALLEHLLAVHSGAVAPQPVLYSAPTDPRAKGHAHEALRKGPLAVLAHAAQHHPDSRLNAHWPQLDMPDVALTPREYLAYFERPQRAPPNVIDDRVAKLLGQIDEVAAYRTPAAYRIANLLAPAGRAQSGELPDSSDLVISPQNALTRFHVDSGFAGLCELLAGEKLWAVCSLHDGLRHGLGGGGSPASMEAFLSLPSAALVRCRAGQLLLLPEGFFHFVVTTRAALGFSSNALTAAGLRMSKECVGTAQGRLACQLEADPDAVSTLQATHKHAFARHLRGVAGVRAALRVAGASADLIERYAAMLEREREREERLRGRG
jgi:hypothetical protein